MKDACGNSRERIIVERIKEMIAERGLRQRDLAESCHNLGYSNGQSTISKVLAGKQRLTVEHVEMFCRVLNIPFSEMIQTDEERCERPFFDFGLPAAYLSLNPAADQEAFKGYVGSYNVYFLSTSSTEKGELKDAKLNISQAEGYCRADLILQFDEENKKEYQGQFLISREMKVAYLVLLNRMTGELVSIYIRYRRFNVKKLAVRLGLMLSCGSGDKMLPTAGYILLTRGSLEESRREELAGVLRLRMSNRVLAVPVETVQEVEEDLRKYLLSPERYMWVDRYKLMRDLLDSGQEARCLKVMGLLSEQALNTVDQVRVDDDVDWEMYYYNKAIQE